MWLRVSACHFCPWLRAGHSSGIKSEQAGGSFLEMERRGALILLGVLVWAKEPLPKVWN